MASPEKQLLEFAARIVYNIEGLSSELKLYFNQYITFHFQGKLSANQIQDIENRKASKAFKQDSQIVEAAATLSLQEMIWVMASLQLLQAEAERLDNRIVSRRIEKKTSELISILNLAAEGEKIAVEKSRIELEMRQYQNRPIIKVRTSILPLSIDYLLRWALLLGFSYAGIELGSVMGYNVLGIPLFIFVLTLFLRRLNKRHNHNLLERYGGENRFNVIHEMGATQYTWLAIYLATSIYILNLLPMPSNPTSVAISLALYYFIYLRYFRLGWLSENDLVRQLEKENIDTSKLTVDENDEVIVRLETKLNSLTGRLEAYVLESALFGALSFSGFLQIMASEIISFKDLENFASSIYASAQAFIELNKMKLDAGLIGLSSKESLLSLISVESLICSIFFLGVIASRLRFSDIGDKVRTAINMAKAYNEKEEALHFESGLPDAKTDRLRAMTINVNSQLNIAYRIMEEINPVMNYMIYFRNAGIISFVVILISSSLFIAGALSWIFLGLVLATILYFNRSLLNRKLKAWALNGRIEFVKKGYWIFGFAMLPLMSALILRIFFQVRNTDFLFPITEFLIGIYLVTWLLLAAHVDEEFGEIDMTLSRQRIWNVVKIIIAVLIFISTLFIALDLTGMREMILINLIGLSIMMYFVGYYLTKKWWLGIICGGIVGSLSNSGVLFKVLHLAGANEMLTIVFLAYLILIPVVYIKRKLFHRLFLRFCIAGFLLSLWYFPPLHQFPASLRVAYEHQTPHISPIMKVLRDNSSQTLIENESNLMQGIAEFENYKNQYQTKFGFTYIYERMVWDYSLVQHFILDSLTKTTQDSVRLRMALRAGNEMNSIFRLFKYQSLPLDFSDGFLIDLCTLEPNVLLAMGRKEDAIQSMKMVLQYDAPGYLKDHLSDRIKELESQ